MIQKIAGAILKFGPRRIHEGNPCFHTYRLARDIHCIGFTIAMKLGTNANCQPALKLFAYRGRPEVFGAHSNRREPKPDIRQPLEATITYSDCEQLRRDSLPDSLMKRNRHES